MTRRLKIDDARASIIIPTRDSADRLASILSGIARTEWDDLEVIIVDNGSRDPEALRVINEANARVIRHDAPFNFSRLVNIGAAASTGSYLVLMNDDVEVRAANWLEPLIALAGRSEVGPVGPLLLYPDDTIQHCGITITDGAPAHIGVGATRDEIPPGLLGGSAQRLAITAACLVVRADVFWSLRGFEELLHTSYNDVDFCLRAARAGLAAIVEPSVVMTHHESATRGQIATPEVRGDWLMFRTRWANELAAGDPWALEAK